MYTLLEKRIKTMSRADSAIELLDLLEKRMKTKSRADSAVELLETLL